MVHEFTDECGDVIRLDSARFAQFDGLRGQVESVAEADEHAGHEDVAEAQERVALPADAERVVSQVWDAHHHGQLLVAT